MALKTEIEVPGIEGEPPEIEVEELPSPDTLPLDMRPDLPAADVPAPASPSNRVAEAAKLDFVSDKLVFVIDLEFPFVLDGVTITAINVRRLTVAEVSEVVERKSGDEGLGYELFAAMTGLPVPVLRGLIDDDGDRVSEACFRFLPRRFRPEAS